MDEDEYNHILAVRAATLKRVRVLETYQAAIGTLPTPQAVELQQAREDIKLYDAQIKRARPSAQATELVPDAPLVMMESQIHDLAELVDDALTQITHHFALEATAREEGQARAAEERRRAAEERQQIVAEQARMAEAQGKMVRAQIRMIDGQAKISKSQRRLWVAFGLLVLLVLVVLVGRVG